MTRTKRLTCLTRDRWLPKEITESGFEVPWDHAEQDHPLRVLGVGCSIAWVAAFSASSGRNLRIRSVHPSHRRSPTIRALTERSSGEPRPYMYPLAFKPKTIAVDVSTLQGPNAHHQDYTEISYNVTSVSPVGTGCRSPRCPRWSATVTTTASRALEPAPATLEC